MSEWIKQKKFGAFRWRRTLIFIRLFIRHIAWVGIRLDFCCQFGGFTNICSGIGKLCYIDFLFFLGCFLFHYLVQEDSLFSFPFDWIVLRCKTDLCYTIFYTIHSKQIFHNWIYNICDYMLKYLNKSQDDILGYIYSRCQNFPAQLLNNSKHRYTQKSLLTCDALRWT